VRKYDSNSPTAKPTPISKIGKNDEIILGCTVILESHQSHLIGKNMSDLINLIYASSATRLMNEEDLLAILKKSHENNGQLNITGMLLYRGGNFLQVLEGEEKVVDERFKVIMGDPRHHQVTLMLKRPVPKRQFEKWEMGFTNIDTIDTSTLPGYTPYLNEPFNSNRFKDVGFAYTFLNMFKEEMR
jgi:hypothetical protein